MMTAAILPPPAAPVQPVTTFDRDAFKAAVAQAERDCAGFPRWTRALKKAAEYLDQDWCTWQLDPHTRDLRVPSSSDHTVRYTVSAGHCPCPADSICWHRAARRLLILAGEIAAQRRQPRPPYADVCDHANALYS